MDECDFILAFVKDRLPAALAETTRFPSGAFDIGIRLGNQLVVIQHSPNGGFGISKTIANDPSPYGHDDWFATSDETVRHLLVLLGVRS